MERALHTMQYTAELTGIEPVVEPWLSEWINWKVTNASGGKTEAWNVDGEVIRGTSPFPTNEEWYQQQSYEGCQFASEFEAVKKFSDGLFERHGYRRKDGRYEIIRSNTERIAVFCHMGFGLAWIAHLLELPLPLVWSGFWLAPSSVTTILWDERSAKWAVPRCLGLGDVSHLYGSRLPISSMGIQANFE
ncbi:hypothetical protein D3C85_1177770 [compost metagenome]